MTILSTLENALGKNRVIYGGPLSKHTTFQIGGPARFYFEAKTAEEMVRAVELAKKLQLPYFVLGGGSNILVGDKGYGGMVIKNKTSGIRVLGYSGKIKNQKSKIKSVLVEADSGVLTNQLVRFTLEEGLEGLEGFLGLPGTIGGAVFVNAHWKKDGVEKRIRELVVAEKFHENVLLSVTFSFSKSKNSNLWEEAKKSVQFRSQSQPVGPSCGCIFKNSPKSAASGRLIESAGLKGIKEGNVLISPHHGNFMINLGGGSASDVLKLISLVKKTVKERFGVKLEEEIIKIGDF